MPFAPCSDSGSDSPARGIGNTKSERTENWGIHLTCSHYRINVLHDRPLYGSSPNPALSYDFGLRTPDT